VLREQQQRSESLAAFGAAVRQFEEVLGELSGQGGRRDQTRDLDRLDAGLGLLQTYCQRGGERPLDEDLEAMAGLARSLLAAMPADYPPRTYALARCAVLLIERITRRISEDGSLVNVLVVGRLRPHRLRPHPRRRPPSR
jgi:hypothetical protein